MPTFRQLLKSPRRVIRSKTKTPALAGAPHRKGVCVKVYITKPKKPNSAQRKVAKIRLSTGRHVIAYIPGQGHNLNEHSVVLIRGGRVPDLPGLHYQTIRGVYDFNFKERINRSNRRSKYSTPRPQTG